MFRVRSSGNLRFGEFGPFAAAFFCSIVAVAIIFTSGNAQKRDSQPCHSERSEAESRNLSSTASRTETSLV
jgi:hypothetical protein